MMMKTTREYDAFGPWILEIDEEYTMPPLFVKSYHEEETPLLLIKIPRRIERRMATPDMHLYDYVIGVFESYLYILKRNQNSVSEKRILIKDILAIKNTVALLLGQLSVYLADDTIKIEYNAVSEEIINKLISLIRERYTSEQKTINLEPIPYDYETIEYRYAGLIDGFICNDPSVKLVAYQPIIHLVTKHKNMWRKIIYFLSKKVLSATAFLTNTKELIVLEREKPIMNKNRMALSYSCLFLPYKNITDMMIVSNKSLEDIKTMQVRAQTQLFSFLYGDSHLQIDELFQVFQVSSSSAAVF